MDLQHMMQILFAAFVVYASLIGWLILVAVAVIVAVVVKAFRKYFLLVVPVLLLLGGTSLKALSNRQYAKEVSGIIQADKLDIGLYQHNPPAGTNVVAAALYVTLVEADIDLLEHGLNRFKHHKATRADVDRLLAQLSRDMEDVPLPVPEQELPAPVPENEETT